MSPEAASELLAQITRSERCVLLLQTAEIYPEEPPTASWEPSSEREWVVYTLGMGRGLHERRDRLIRVLHGALRQLSVPLQ